VKIGFDGHSFPGEHEYGGAKVTEASPSFDRQGNAG
jgi:hypothetical protein